MRPRLQDVSRQVKSDEQRQHGRGYDRPMALRRRERDPDIVERWLAWKLAGRRGPGESIRAFALRLGMPKSTVEALISRQEAGSKVRPQFGQILGVTEEQMLAEAAKWSQEQRAPVNHATTERPVAKK